jgi:hypothetical protein
MIIKMGDPTRNASRRVDPAGSQNNSMATIRAIARPLRLFIVIQCNARWSLSMINHKYRYFTVPDSKRIDLCCSVMFAPGLLYVIIHGT